MVVSVGDIQLDASLSPKPTTLLRYVDPKLFQRAKGPESDHVAVADDGVNVGCLSQQFDCQRLAKFRYGVETSVICRPGDDIA
jgi:hypothetical protein